MAHNDETVATIGELLVREWQHCDDVRGEGLWRARGRGIYGDSVSDAPDVREAAANAGFDRRVECKAG